MLKSNHYVFSIFLIITSLLIVGCKDKMGGTYPMSIKVTLEGTAVEGAIVTLSETGGKTASGVTNASGVATIKSTEGWEGVFPGEYAVTIKKTEQTISSTQLPGSEGSSGDDNAFVTSREILHAKYGNAQTSGLTVTQVNKKGAFEFDLTENP